ncbi:MAG: bis(5'-nucleosyl)-tetraphosphatase (symmetrical) YqeK [Candidatus Eremiobacteraeota bacterium]|nr:bis(5'-nucleosyl)-tetraphosphatase (symmetrical) YqeK [Candidatus Eremiobacteraeota bacterium]
MSRANGIEFIRLCKRVRDTIGQRHRHAHTLRVARLAVRLSRRHGENVDRARLAGMLHDLARLWPPERLLAEAEARGLALDAFDREHPRVLHARIGAELAREQFGVDDVRVLSAIRAHTLGSGSMSRLDAIIYMADSVEPGRDFAERAQLERLAFEDLNAAMRATLSSTIAHYGASGNPLSPATAAALAQFSHKGAENWLISTTS